MQDYTGIMRFYRVEMSELGQPNYASLSAARVFRSKQQQFKNEYRKWAWDNCSDTWAISEIQTEYNMKENRPDSFFYIGFSCGEDKLVFKLGHDPVEVSMYKGAIPIFVREKS